jgi:hypothetical protein
MNEESQTLPEDQETPAESSPVEEQMPDPAASAVPSEPLQSDVPEEQPKPDASAASNISPAEKRFFPPTWTILVLLLGVVVVAAVALGVLRQTWLAPQPEGDAGSLSVEKLSTFESPPEIPANVQILQENGTPLSPALPDLLMVGGVGYDVIPVPLESGRWPVPVDSGDVATWVYGTVVNYVIGLPYTTTTESRLASLDPSARITLTLNTGTSLVFGAPQARRYAADNVEPLSQSQPGLTLVLLGSQEKAADRLVVQARYLPEASPTEGGPQKIDGLNVRVLDAVVVNESADGQAFVVEYEVTSLSAGPLPTDLFDLVLVDGDGQRFSTNPTISQQGQNGSLPAQIAAGETVRASAGYRILRDTSPPLTWVFRADPASGETARFSLPYEAPLPGPPQPQVSLADAFVDEGRDVIVINGVVRNTGESPLTVAPSEVKLSSSAGEADLIVATPSLPWEVAPGEERSVELQFVRPPAEVDSVLLDILGFTFQLDGLP